MLHDNVSLISKSIADEWFDAIFWIPLLLEAFVLKQCVAFNLIVLGFLK